VKSIKCTVRKNIFSVYLEVSKFDQRQIDFYLAVIYYFNRISYYSFDVTEK